MWWTRPIFDPACCSDLTVWVHEKVDRNLAGTFAGKPTDKTAAAIKKLTELNCPEKSSKPRVPAAGIAHEKH